MRPKYDYGDEVRVTRNVRNDGTYPGMDIGQLLLRRGSVGHVRDIGTFLQDQIIYTVHFIEQDRVIGCREEELILASAPWVPSRFEFRERVYARVALAINGSVIVEPGTKGEVMRVLRDAPGGVAYEVNFPGRMLQVPESALDGEDGDAEAAQDLAAGAGHG